MLHCIVILYHNDTMIYIYLAFSAFLFRCDKYYCFYSFLISFILFLILFDVFLFLIPSFLCLVLVVFCCLFFFFLSFFLFCCFCFFCIFSCSPTNFLFVFCFVLFFICLQTYQKIQTGQPQFDKLTYEMVSWMENYHQLLADL